MMDNDDNSPLLDLEGLATQLGARKSSFGYTCLCPAHNDSERSFSLWRGNNGAVAFKCFAGCTRDEIVSALTSRGLMVDLSAPTGIRRPPPSEVKEILNELKDIDGTPGEIYLQGRGISGFMPPSVRYRRAAWKSPQGSVYDAVVGVVQRPDGEVTAALQVYVTQEGDKVPLNIRKRVIGELRGGCVVLPGMSPTVVCEGIETGLSIWLATGYQVLVAVSLTNFGKIELEAVGCEVIVAGDADVPGSQSDQQFRREVMKLLKRGFKPKIARPERYEDLKKTDWNDVYVREGAETVCVMLQTIIDGPVEGIERFDPGNPHGSEEEGSSSNDNGDFWLTDLNDKHAVIVDAGKVTILNEEWDDLLERGRKTFSSFTDFRNRYNNKSVMIRGNRGTPKFIPVGDFWINNPGRRQYDKIIFAPGKEFKDCYNLWKGFAVTPSPDGSWELLKQHLLENICSGNEEHYQYVLNWLAFGVQHPDRPAEVALVLRGPRGAGKSILARTYGKLFGQHYLAISQAKHLVGAFNSHLRDAVVLFADEAFWAGDKQGENVLKTLITEDMIPIEQKGKDVIVTKNMLHIMVASNNEWVVPAGVDERRFAVFDVASTHARDTTYFGSLIEELEAGGYEAMLYELQSVDLTGFDIRSAPETKGLFKQKAESFSPFEKWWYTKLDVGSLGIGEGDFDEWVANDYLYQNYLNVMTNFGHNRKMSEVEFWQKLQRLIVGNRNDKALLWRRQRKRITMHVHGYAETKQAWGYTIPDLMTCRRSFEEMIRQHIDWTLEDTKKLEDLDTQVPF